MLQTKVLAAISPSQAKNCGEISIILSCLCLKMGSDHLHSPGAFVFQWGEGREKGGFVSPLLPAPKKARAGGQALGPRTLRHAHPGATRAPPVSKQVSRTLPRPSRRAAGPQECQAACPSAWFHVPEPARPALFTREGEALLSVPPPCSSYTSDSHTGTESESWLCMELSPVSESSSFPGQLLANPRA